jgi:hypothetical protein
VRLSQLRREQKGKKWKKNGKVRSILAADVAAIDVCNQSWLVAEVVKVTAITMLILASNASGLTHACLHLSDDESSVA